MLGYVAIYSGQSANPQIPAATNEYIITDGTNCIELSLYVNEPAENKVNISQVPQCNTSYAQATNTESATSSTQELRPPDISLSDE